MSKHKRKPHNLRKDSRALKLLSAIASGSANVFVATAQATAIPRGSLTRLIWKPGQEHAPIEIDFQKIFEDSRERTRYRRAVQTLQKRRYTELVRQKDAWVLVVTKEGKQYLKEISLDNLRIIEPKQWDGRWRIVLYDVPEKHRLGRDILRDRLKSLGMFQFQKSAFVSPYPCADQLDVIIQYHKLEPFVTFFTTDSLGYQEAKALHHFKLKR